MTKTKAIALLLVVFLFFAGFGAWGVVALLHQVQRGRSDAIRVTCAVMTAISQAGRDVIVGPSNAPDTPFVRRLEALGYPPHNVRKAQAEQAADAYVKGINRHVVLAVGAQKARGVVLPGGQIDCEKVLLLARAR